MIIRRNSPWLITIFLFQLTVQKLHMQQLQKRLSLLKHLAVKLQWFKFYHSIAAEYISANQTNDLIERARTAIIESLDAAKAKFHEQGVEVETKLLEGQVVHREIVKAAEESHADLIIIGSHGRTGFKKLFLGSVAQSLLGESHIPVLIVRE